MHASVPFDAECAVVKSYFALKALTCGASQIVHNWILCSCFCQNALACFLGCRRASFNQSHLRASFSEFLMFEETSCEFCKIAELPSTETEHRTNTPPHQWFSPVARPITQQAADEASATPTPNMPYANVTWQFRVRKRSLATRKARNRSE